MAEETQDSVNDVIRYIFENAEEALHAVFSDAEIHKEDLTNALLIFASMDASEKPKWITIEEAKVLDVIMNGTDVKALEASIRQAFEEKQKIIEETKKEIEDMFKQCRDTVSDIFPQPIVHIENNNLNAQERVNDVSRHIIEYVDEKTNATFADAEIDAEDFGNAMAKYASMDEGGRLEWISIEEKNVLNEVINGTDVKALEASIRQAFEQKQKIIEATKKAIAEMNRLYKDEAFDVFSQLKSPLN